MLFQPQQNQIAYPPELQGTKGKYTQQNQGQIYVNEQQIKVYVQKLDKLTDDYRRLIEDLINQPRTNLLKIYDILKYQNNIFIVTENQEETKRMDNLSEQEDKIEVIQQIAQGLDDLHKMSYIHRFVCPDSIKCINGIWKLTRLENVNDDVCVSYPPPVGNFRYHAPEYCMGSKYSTKIDIFGLACVAYELFTKEYLFIDQNRPRNKIPEECKVKLNQLPEKVRTFIELNIEKNERSLTSLLCSPQIDVRQTQNLTQQPQPANPLNGQNIPIMQTNHGVQKNTQFQPPNGAINLPGSRQSAMPQVYFNQQSFPINNPPPPFINQEGQKPVFQPQNQGSFKPPAQPFQPVKPPASQPFNNGVNQVPVNNAQFTFPNQNNTKNPKFQMTLQNPPQSQLQDPNQICQAQKSESERKQIEEDKRKEEEKKEKIRKLTKKNCDYQDPVKDITFQISQKVRNETSHLSQPQK